MAATMLPEVEYRDIPGFPGYKAGADGTIWSCHNRNLGMTSVWHRMKGESRPTSENAKNGNCYVFVGLSFETEHRVFSVHSLVLLAFVGPRPPGMLGCHDNDIGIDNRISNLKWATRAENILDRDRNGNTARGSRQGLSQLTEKDAQLVISLIKRGWTNKEIARHMGKCKANNIGEIRRGRTWRHVWGDYVFIPCKIGTPSRMRPVDALS